MKILIAVGMVIIFISVFFMMFTFNTLMGQGVGECLFGGICGQGSGYSLVFGILIIATFGVVDAFTIYLIFVNAIKRRPVRPLG